MTITKIISAMALISLSCILVFWFFRIVSRMDQKTTEELMNKNEFIIRKSKATLMMILCLIFSPVGFASMCETATEYILLSFIPLLCILFTISWLRWKITVKENQITFTYYIGKPKTFTFSDITNAKRGELRSRGGIKLGEFITIYYHIEDKPYKISVSSYDPYFYTLTSRIENEDIPIKEGCTNWFFFY